MNPRERLLGRVVQQPVLPHLKGEEELEGKGKGKGPRSGLVQSWEKLGEDGDLEEKQEQEWELREKILKRKPWRG